MVALTALTLPLQQSAHAQGTLTPALKGVYDAQVSFYQAGITASDLDRDGRQELLIGNQNGMLYCFSANATLLWRFFTKSRIQGTPTCSDVDGDGKKEIWIGDMSGYVWGLDSNGKVLSKWGWPKKTHEVGGLSGVFSSPAIGDINGDGTQDIVVGNYGQRVYAWSYKGQALPGWPYNNEDTIWSSPALADLDWDGVKEVIIGADSTGGPNWPYPPGGLLYAFDEDASIMPGFPKVTPEVTWSSPAVADIDGDNRYEIIVGTGHYYTATGKLTTEGHRLYAYNHDGSSVRGWPAWTAGTTFSSPAVGDINGDGVKEIVVGTMRVRGIGEEGIIAFRPDGAAIFEVKGLGGPTMGSPALGDVSGDGLPDIILGSGQHVYAWDHTGKELWKQDLGNFVAGNPAVGDFDADGRVEVAVATGDAPGGAFKGGKLYVFDFGPKAAGAGTDAALFPWPMFRKTGNHHATVLTGKEPPPPPPPSAKTWYLAEGSTAGGMETWVLVQNPNDEPAAVRLTYMTSNGAVPGPSVAIGPRSRATFNAAASVPDQWDVSTLVSSDRTVIAERAMYGSNRTWAHDSIGATVASKTWYLAEGSTAGGMETWILVQNPQRTAVSVNLSYQTSKGPRNGPEAVIPAFSRKTFNVAEVVPDNYQVSTKVTASKPVIAERAMYGNNRAWGTDSVGARLRSTTWYLAEGSTAGGMETWILVQNPTHPDTSVQIDYLTPHGRVEGPSFEVPSGTRGTVNVADTLPGEWSVSAVVTADNPVIAERAMYGNNRTWAHDSIGVVTPKKTWYLAEGSTAGGMETWILVQNPGNSRAKVTLTYMTQQGAVTGPTVIIPPRSRRTFFAADSVPDSWEVSTLVTANRDVIVERAVYGNNRTWAHESIGFAE